MPQNSAESEVFWAGLEDATHSITLAWSTREITVYHLMPSIRIRGMVKNYFSQGVLSALYK